jgi:hypothetical protein
MEKILGVEGKRGKDQGREEKLIQEYNVQSTYMYVWKCYDEIP